MSLDNVLAGTGAAHEHPIVLVAGLTLMGIASNFIAGLLHKHRWIGWVGLFVIEAPFPADAVPAPVAPVPSHQP